ncbi:hypothetical protein [Pseudonocardia pini]|uniref:hypothetical protein n=1 Tax=Pseudonocardia pini TaxID=2758030 RepID=UPI0015EFFC9C|nr:hypothetical protein [Pseudonocardia pini]
MVLRLNVRIEGATELMAACRRVGRDAEDELRDQSFDIARTLADRIKYAGAASDRQSARASRTVRERRDRFPVITAGPHPLLLGSEFGATRHFGWYAAGRYYSSPGRQFRPHRGSASYWFFETAEQMQPYVKAEWREVAKRIVREWPRG